MKIHLLTLILFFVYSTNIFSQRKKNNKADFVKSTSSAIRVADYEKRLELERNSIAKNIYFRNIGPTVMSGRVVDLAVNPNDPTHFYVAYASGGLWETKNHGNTFTPIFDNNIVMTLGDIEVDSKN